MSENAGLEVQYGAHWLAFDWVLNPGDGPKLRGYAQTAVENGATAFEIMSAPINNMDADETGTALKEAGITTAVICHCYPDEKIDPLSDDESVRSEAQKQFDAVIDLADGLRKHVVCNVIAGPSCWVLGKKYEGSKDENRWRVPRFYAPSMKRIIELDLTVAAELLRKEEDLVMEDVEEAKTLLSCLPGNFKFHLDMFHFRCREIGIVAAIRELQDLIAHVHFNGKDRVPPGHAHDDIEWAPIQAALVEIGYKGVGSNEPFCQAVRDAVPQLGTGLPPAMPAVDVLSQTAAHLKEVGILVS